MQPPSVLSRIPRPSRFFSLPLAACVLLLLSAPSRAATGSPAGPAESATEAHQKKSSSKINAKELEKYDIDRIGRRDIGHGFNIYSLQREHELGQSLAASFDRAMKLVKDPVINEYVNRIAQKIVGNSDAVVPFTIKVIDAGDTPRAYGLPGGFLYVDSALILSADDEAELAAVMAHEIAHVAARHATRALSRKQMSRMVDTIAFMAGPIGAGVADAGGIAGPLSLKKFSRESEYEADLLGIEYAYAAGYDPQALLDALEKLHAVEVRREQEIAQIPGVHFASHIPFHNQIARSFASYPLTEERIQRLQSEISAFLPNRRDYILDTEEFQQVKTRLLSYKIPMLRHHPAGEDDKGPVLRRVSSGDSDGSSDGPVAISEAPTPTRLSKAPDALLAEFPASRLP
jgi:Zn-dependent protease with chaperone function